MSREVHLHNHESHTVASQKSGEGKGMKLRFTQEKSCLNFHNENVKDYKDVCTKEN